MNQYSLNFDISNYTPEGEKKIFVKDIEVAFETPDILSVKDFTNSQEAEFGNTPIVLVKKSTYSEAQRIAQRKYREKYPEKYCKVQRDFYHNKKEDPEWKAKFNERSKVNNKKYRDKKKEEQLSLGIDVKPRGRPRKATLIGKD
jgi:hypothetical protein